MRIFPPLRRILRFWRSRSCWTTARRLCTKRGSDETRGLGFLKVARGRSWRPEIGMEHASRDRRSGNEGVGARWRGRFRIFSARHRSRTEASRAENSGMTMLFFSLEVAPVSEGDSFTRSGAAARGALILGIIIYNVPQTRNLGDFWQESQNRGKSTERVGKNPRFLPEIHTFSV